MLGTLLAGEAFHYMMVFARIGAGVMVFPGLGDALVNMRIRLLLTLTLTALVTPVLVAGLPPPPASPPQLAALILAEVLIGLMIGMIGRFLMTALDVAGMVASFSLSLSSATVFNPLLANQGTLTGALFTLLGLVLIFVTDMHHLMLRGIVASYAAFPPGQWPATGDVADLMVRLLNRSFGIGVQIAAPFIIVGVVLSFAMGLIARLMPQIQIFFIAIPIQLGLGLFVFAITLSGAMLFWLRNFADALSGTLPL